MVFRTPPSGYRSMENPLLHDWNIQTHLDVENELLNSTIVPIFRASEKALLVEDVEVNPQHASYKEDAGCTVFMGSIVPRISVTITAQLDQLAFETDSIEHMNFKWMPIYTAFLSSLDAQNDGSPASDIETILELNHGTNNKEVTPLYDGNDLQGTASTGSIPLSDVTDSDEAFTDWNLTTDALLEAVAFDEQAFWDAKAHYTNKGMLNKVTGRFTNVTLDYHRRPYVYSSNNFTNPIVKRGNPYTFCGILFHLPQAGEFGQLCGDSDVSSSIAHIRIGVRVRFEEWNNAFDQTTQ